MKPTDYPSIEIYRYHFNGILQSATNANLDAVGESIVATVQPGHREYPLLMEAGKKRRQELAEQKEQEAK